MQTPPIQPSQMDAISSPSTLNHDTVLSLIFPPRLHTWESFLTSFPISHLIHHQGLEIISPKYLIPMAITLAHASSPLIWTTAAKT